MIKQDQDKQYLYMILEMMLMVGHGERNVKELLGIMKDQELIEDQEKNFLLLQ